MTKPGKIILVIVLLLAIGIGAYALMRDDDFSTNNDTNGGSTSSSNSSENSSESSDVAIDAVTITYTDNGFTPATVTVSSGATITVTNDSSETVGFKSDPHPVHTENTELNLDDLGPGQTDTFTVSTVGSWGYHNHLNPDQTGTIVVE